MDQEQEDIHEANRLCTDDEATVLIEDHKDEGAYVESAESSDDMNITAPDENKRCNGNNNIYVAKTLKNKTGGRKWDKAQYCLFCKQKVSKIGRHLTDKHGSEFEVKRIKALKEIENSKEAKREKNILLEKLRKRGNHLHNQEVIKDGNGVIVVERRPSEDVPYQLYLICEFCVGYYHKTELSRHMRTCKLKPIDAEITGRVQSRASMLSYQDPAVSVALKKIISCMNVDDVSLCVRSDNLLIQYGNKLCIRHRKSGDQQHYISNKMRELARLLLEARQYSTNIKTMNDIILPNNFDFVVQAVTELAGWDEETGRVKTPSIGIKLGHSLVKLSKIRKGEAIIKNDQNLKLLCDDFCSLISLRWSDEINRMARIELEQRKWNKPLILPLASDLQILRRDLKSLAKESVAALATNNCDISAWRDLATSTLVTIVLFNRRRGGEPAKMKIEDFQKRHQVGMNDEIQNSLSDFERTLCKRYKLIELRGKRGRRVPIILTKDVEKSMQLLVQLRSKVGVAATNPYVFSIPTCGSTKNVRGPDAMRKHLKKCDLKCPGAINSTNLRKHIATLSQLLNLEGSDMEMLARFLGHDVAIHKQYYRLPEDTLQLAKCSKVLLAMEKGVSEFKGKKLEEIEMNLDGL